NLSWTGSQVFDGANGNDMVIVSDNLNLKMEPTLLTLGSGVGAFKVKLANIDSFKYKAFDPTLTTPVSGNNTITLSDWAGSGIIEAGDGNDVLVVDRSSATTAQSFDLKPSNFAQNGKNVTLFA